MRRQRQQHASATALAGQWNGLIECNTAPLCKGFEILPKLEACGEMRPDRYGSRLV